MATEYTNILTDEELSYLSNAPEVMNTKALIDARASGSVYFSVNIPANIRQKLSTAFGIELTSLSSIPMRWVKGDTRPHVDVGATAFETTYLMYLNNSPGSLVVDGASYPITQGSAYSFQEGLHHETLNTGNDARLLIGPMSERGMVVGVAPITYFPTQADAEATNFPNRLAYGSSYTIGNDIYSGSITGYTKWRIASNSNGLSNQSLTYQNDDVLAEFSGEYAYYYLYPANAVTDACCADSTQLVGLSYNFRNDITTGNIIAQTPPTQFKSYSDYHKLKMVKAARK